MIVKAIPASPDHVARAREIAGAGYGLTEFRRASVLGAIGAALVAAALLLAFGPWSARHLMAVIACLLGFGSLALGLFNLAGALVGLRLTRELKEVVAPVLRDGRVTRVDVEAYRVFACAPLDEGSPALVITDGRGRGMYVNSPLLDPFIALGGMTNQNTNEVSTAPVEDIPDPATLPGRVTFILTSPDGLVLGIICEGPRVRIEEAIPSERKDKAEPEFGTNETDLSELPFTPANRPQDAAILPTCDTPHWWRSLVAGTDESDATSE